MVERTSTPQKAAFPLAAVLAASVAAGVVGGLLAWVVATRMAPGAVGIEDAQFAVLDQRIAQQADLIRDLQAEIDELQQGRPRSGPRGNAVPGDVRGDGGSAVPPLLEDRDNRFGGYAELMLLSARRRTNNDLKTIRQSRLIEVFGAPSETLSDECAQPTSPRLNASLVMRNVGPFRARLIRPAVDSLERIFKKLKADEPALYANLRSYGGLCARLIRGSSERISRHAFGVALDVSVGGTIDAMGDGKTQFGLILLAEYFQEEGWLWGAAFGREDSMHFEVSAELFERWLAEGLI